MGDAGEVAPIIYVKKPRIWYFVRRKFTGLKRYDRIIGGMDDKSWGGDPLERIGGKDR